MLLLLLLEACAPAPPSAWGQWIWTPADAAIWQDLRGEHPDLAAGVLVAELRYDGTVTTSLRESPSRGGDAPAIVIRLDDSLHAIWQTREDADVADAIGERLAAILRMAPRHFEVQLDYDCPVRLLPRWAAVLGRLQGGALAGERVWITSLLAHLREPAYGTLFRGKIAGHILQVFDTGEAPADAGTVARLAAAADVPYRLGIAAFERGTDGVPFSKGGGRTLPPAPPSPPFGPPVARFARGPAITDHRGWFAAVGTACVAPRCEAVWVFPGGQPWEPE